MRTTEKDEDAALMIAVKNGDTGAFEGLLLKYEGPIINYVHRFTQDAREAEDIAQEVFLRVYKAAGTYVPSAKFSTWLYRIASNLSLDHLKKRKHSLTWAAQPVPGRDRDGGDIDVKDAASRTPETTAEDAAQKELVSSALSGLPDNQRLALTLKVYEDKSYKEISEILGCSVPAVESLIFRARQNLVKTLRSGTMT